MNGTKPVSSPASQSQHRPEHRPRRLSLLNVGWIDLPGDHQAQQLCNALRNASIASNPAAALAFINAKERTSGSL
jgi:hypothetical protein